MLCERLPLHIFFRPPSAGIVPGGDDEDDELVHGGSDRGVKGLELIVRREQRNAHGALAAADGTRETDSARAAAAQLIDPHVIVLLFDLVLPALPVDAAAAGSVGMAIVGETPALPAADGACAAVCALCELYAELLIHLEDTASAVAGSAATLRQYSPAAAILQALAWRVPQFVLRLWPLLRQLCVADAAVRARSTASALFLFAAAYSHQVGRGGRALAGRCLFAARSDRSKPNCVSSSLLMTKNSMSCNDHFLSALRRSSPIC